jgi:ubiquinone/menaquinone biosynthesis C-methylase UbiE
MTAQQIADLEGLKTRVKATWMAGDYGRVAQLTEGTASEFIDRRHIKPNMKVLDVACGNGNLAIPAAKTGAVVTGVDIAPNLLDQARTRAVQEKLTIDFQEGDAESLAFADGAFDMVVSMFGAMFAPRPELVARELTRVCRSGGQIAMANWTPTGFIGDLFKATAKHVAPPVGVQSPLQWGDENVVRERLGNRVSDIKTVRVMAQLTLPFSVAETIEFYRIYYGPTLRAFAGLSTEAQGALRRDLEALYARYNQARDGTVSVAAEYLDIVATRA